MRIVFDCELDQNGAVHAVHFIETDDSVVQSMLKACMDSDVARKNAGYTQISHHPEYVSKTRWEVVLAEVVRLDDTKVRSLLGV